MARRDLAGALLQLKALGVDSLAEFDFPAPPPPQLAAKAVEALHVLSALDSQARCHRPTHPSDASHPSAATVPCASLPLLPVDRRWG